MNKKRVLQLAVAAGCMIVVICACLSLRTNAGELVLVNDAQESVIHATVEINGVKFEFDNIPVDGIRRMKYKPQADNHYTIAVEFHYERKLGPQNGYFSGRVKTDPKLVVKREEIVLESGKE